MLQPDRHLVAALAADRLEDVAADVAARRQQHVAAIRREIVPGRLWRACHLRAGRVNAEGGSFGEVAASQKVERAGAGADQRDVVAFHPPAEFVLVAQQQAAGRGIARRRLARQRGRGLHAAAVGAADVCAGRQAHGPGQVARRQHGCERSGGERLRVAMPALSHLHRDRAGRREAIRQAACHRQVVGRSQPQDPRLAGTVNRRVDLRGRVHARIAIARQIHFPADREVVLRGSVAVHLDARSQVERGRIGACQPGELGGKRAVKRPLRADSAGHKGAALRVDRVEIGLRQRAGQRVARDGLARRVGAERVDRDGAGAAHRHRSAGLYVGARVAGTARHVELEVADRQAARSRH